MSAVKGRLETVKGVPPTVGTEWRANFFRLDHPNGKPQTGSSWSPPMVGDFHALDKFGTLVFADSEGKTAPIQQSSSVQPPPAQPVPPAAAPGQPGGPHQLNPMLEHAMKGDDSPEVKPAPAAPVKSPVPVKSPAPAPKPASLKSK